MRAPAPFTTTGSPEHVRDCSLSYVERARDLAMRIAFAPHRAHKLITLSNSRLMAHAETQSFAWKGAHKLLGVFAAQQICDGVAFSRVEIFGYVQIAAASPRSATLTR